MCFIPMPRLLSRTGEKHRIPSIRAATHDYSVLSVSYQLPLPFSRAATWNLYQSLHATMPLPTLQSWQVTSDSKILRPIWHTKAWYVLITKINKTLPSSFLLLPYRPLGWGDSVLVTSPRSCSISCCLPLSRLLFSYLSALLSYNSLWGAAALLYPLQINLPHSPTE